MLIAFSCSGLAICRARWPRAKVKKSSMLDARLLPEFSCDPYSWFAWWGFPWRSLLPGAIWASTSSHWCPVDASCDYFGADCFRNLWTMAWLPDFACPAASYSTLSTHFLWARSSKFSRSAWWFASSNRRTWLQSWTSRFETASSLARSPPRLIYPSEPCELAHHSLSADSQGQPRTACSSRSRRSSWHDPS